MFIVKKDYSIKKVYVQSHRKFNRLNEIKRGKIAGYLEQGVSRSEIACKLSSSKLMSYHEIRKEIYKGRYQPHIAENN